MRWAYQSASAFFGLGTDYREYLLEMSFILSMRMQMSFEIFYNMPITYRRWYLERIRKMDQPKPESDYEDLDKPLVRR